MVENTRILASMKLLPLFLAASTILGCWWPGPIDKPTVLKVETCTLPEPFRFGTVLKEGGNARLIGNEYGNGYFGQIRRTIDLDTCATVSTSTLAYNTAHHDSVWLNGQAVTVGGMVRNSSGAVFSSAWSQYDHNQALGYLYSPGVHDPELVKISDTEAIAMGGWEWATTSAQVWLIDDTLAKAALPNLNTSRSYRTAHHINGKVYVIGGLHYTGATLANLASIEVIDPVAGTTTTAGYSLATGRRYHSSVAIGSKVYVLAGSNIPSLGRGAGLASIEAIDTVAGTVASCGALTYPRQHAQTVHLQRGGKDYVAIFGGEHNNQPVPQAELLDVATCTTTVLNGVSWGLTDHDRIHACSGNKVYLVGGENITASPHVGTNKVYTVTFDDNTTCVE